MSKFGTCLARILVYSTCAHCLHLLRDRHFAMEDAYREVERLTMEAWEQRQEEKRKQRQAQNATSENQPASQPADTKKKKKKKQTKTKLNKGSKQQQQRKKKKKTKGQSSEVDYGDGDPDDPRPLFPDLVEHFPPDQPEPSVPPLLYNFTNPNVTLYTFTVEAANLLQLVRTTPFPPFCLLGFLYIQPNARSLVSVLVRCCAHVTALVSAFCCTFPLRSHIHAHGHLFA